jgi:hypothetical protein
MLTRYCRGRAYERAWCRATAERSRHDRCLCVVGILNASPGALHPATKASLGRRGRAIAFVWSPTPERRVRCHATNRSLAQPCTRERRGRRPAVKARNAAWWSPKPVSKRCREIRCSPGHELVGSSAIYRRSLVTAGAVSRRPARFRPPLGSWALRRHRPERSPARSLIASDPHQS